jgi:hypothetical protein
MKRYFLDGRAKKVGKNFKKNLKKYLTMCPIWDTIITVRKRKRRKKNENPSLAQKRWGRKNC